MIPGRDSVRERARVKVKAMESQPGKNSGSILRIVAKALEGFRHRRKITGLAF